MGGGMNFSITVKAVGIGALLVAASAGAQSFPSKPFRVVVPFTPGSGGTMASDKIR